jgi:hypothetical protein
VTVWDVVNEPIDPSQPDGFRRSPWFNILGPQYIDIALQAARAANPNAKLYINDFDTTNPAHRDPLIALVNDLKSRGIPIDGIGHQMHNNIGYPPPQTVTEAVNLFAATGVEQSVTEMDVSIYDASFPTPFTSYTDIPASRHVTVGYSYLGFIQALEQLQGKVVSVTIWGTSDDKSWLTSSTKVDAPLLFDTSLKAKPAYWALVDPLQLPGANLSVAMTAAPAVTPAGQGATYTMTVTNVADHDQPFDPTDDDLPAANVSMTMATPPHTAFQSLTPPSGWSCTTPAIGAPGQITCTIGSLAVAAPAQFPVVVTVNDCSTQDGTAVLASASVTSTTPNPNPTPNTTASASVQVSNAPPVISAVPPLTTSVECHTTYTDPGASAIDACDGSVRVSSSSNVNVNAVGTYGVTYTAADSAGGQATPVTRTVNVIDTTPPSVAVTGANPMAAECGSTFTDPGAIAVDACAGALPVMVSGAVNPAVVGSYIIGYSATDPSGNTGSASRLVTVADTTPPVVTIAGPNPMNVECATPFVDPGATANDMCAGPVPVTETGAVNPNAIGSYTLDYTATDPSGNSAGAPRVVTVADTSPPQIDVVDLTILDEDVTVVFDDRILKVNGRVQSLPSSGIRFIDGREIVYDGTSIRVHGRVIPADGRTLVLLHGDHKSRTFTISDLVAGATDTCDGSVSAGAVVVTKVTSDEVDEGRHDGDGEHDRGGKHDGDDGRDVVIAGDCHSVTLRIESEDDGNGRVYTIGLRAQDASGNTTTQSVTVMVPPDEDDGLAVDSGPAYTVTSACN